MKKLWLIVLLTFISACSTGYTWSNAPLDHDCTVEQMQRVEKETKWCSENTDYLKTYCYGAAIMRICTPKDKARVYPTVKPNDK